MGFREEEFGNILILTISNSLRSLAGKALSLWIPATLGAVLVSWSSEITRGAKTYFGSMLIMRHLVNIDPE